ncbi:MAG: T9SS type A sorting domain-containing protein [Bacteroidetes bacterium]|nr:MAG: T9SS type A sorting domain-containing protein [Bacteroidota bacterium]
MANSNLLISGSKPKNTVPELYTRTINIDNSVQVYPNPVTNNKFIVQFNQLEQGNYTIQLIDVAGRPVLQKQVNVSGDNQTQDINVNALSARGVYLVKVTDHNKKSVFSTKIVVQ